MGMTEVRLYFTQIIGNNSMNVNQIPTKLGTEIHFNAPFTCAKFQPDWSMHWYFTANFAKYAKRRKKSNENKTNFYPLISWKLLERFSSNLLCGLLVQGGTSVENLAPIG